MPQRVLVPQDPEGKMWDRMRGEPNQLYDRFCRFRDLGPERTIRAVYRQEWATRSTKPCPAVNGTWFLHSRAWQWVARAEAYDAHQRELDRRGREEALTAARERRLALLTGVESLALERLTQRDRNGKLVVARELRAKEAADLLIKVQEEKRKEMELATPQRGRAGDPDDPMILIKPKVYLVDPQHPVGLDDL
jgi:hypothetical protein